jgi:hypothetical protein
MFFEKGVKWKIRNTPMGIPRVEKNFILEPYSLRATNAKAFGTSCYVALCATLAEQAAAAVLMSKLLDTSALAYLRHHRHRR